MKTQVAGATITSSYFNPGLFDEIKQNPKILTRSALIFGAGYLSSYILPTPSALTLTSSVSVLAAVVLFSEANADARDNAQDLLKKRIVSPAQGFLKSGFKTVVEKFASTPTKNS